MKSIRRLCMLAVMLCVASAGSASAGATVVAELTAMLHDFLANSATAASHDRFWADDLVYTSSNGTRFGKAEIMHSLAEADTADNDEPTVAYRGEDVRVQLFGGTAVVTFRLVGTANDGSKDAEYFNTGTFVKRDGEWRAVAWQATMIPAADEANSN
jgi:hypothetical protein